MKLLTFGNNYWVTDMKHAGVHHSILIEAGAPAVVRNTSEGDGLDLPSNWVFVGLINRESY